MEGLISNADVRKGLLKDMDDLNKVEVEDIVNYTLAVIEEATTVIGMLRYVMSFDFPINYLTVVNISNQVRGVNIY